MTLLNSTVRVFESLASYGCMGKEAFSLTEICSSSVDITARTFVSRCHFDANLYSEPLAIMNVIYEFERAKNQNGFAWHYSLSAPRLRRLVATRKSLRNRVAEFIGIDVNRLHVEKPPSQMEHAKVTLLRVLQVRMSGKIRS